MRRLTMRLLRIALYFAVSVVVLSIGLRIYSAWQIPRAKRLLQTARAIRPGQKIDASLLSVMRVNNFAPASWPCVAEYCYYATSIDSFHPSETKSWLARHGGEQLGLRLWSARVMLKVVDGRIEQIRSGLVFFSGYREIGGELNGSLRIRFPDEASPDFRIWEFPRFKNLLPQVEYTPETSSTLTDKAFTTSFSCIWSLRICKTGYEVFPAWLQLSDDTKMLEDLQQNATEPCPASKMYARVRDSDQIALGTVIDNSPVQVKVQINQVLRNDPQFPTLFRDTFLKSSLDQRLVRNGIHEGAKVILTSGYQCDLLPATKENLTALNEALLKFPARIRDPREFYSINFGPQMISIPPPPVPRALSAQN